MAPLPRAFQWLVADAGPGQSVLPPLRQGSGDAFVGPHDDLILDEALAAHAGAGLAVISGDLPVRTQPDQALEAIRLLLLVNDWRLPALAPAASGGAAPPQAWPASAFGSVAVTPDEFGPAWQRGRLEAAVELQLNGRHSGRVELGAVSWHFGQLLSQACRTRPLRAGTVLGATLDAITPESGAQDTALRCGDRVRIEIRGRDGQSPLGAIEQVLSPD
jgi:fumarylacetoacetate (FAA) hydrolase